jgi:hypothetical protein
VQHDRGGWRCLVAGSFEVTSGGLLARIRRRKFGSLSDRRRPAVPQPHICSCGCCMAPMTDGREQQPRPSHSVFVITWAKLVATDDDFVCQYFQVKHGKRIINPEDFGTLSDYLHSVTRCFRPNRKQSTAQRTPYSPTKRQASLGDGGSTCHTCGNTILRDVLYADF